ncbi:MAG: Gfo/Idh/MocA family oxidoreductase [Balneolaceae bacterium]|nr:Gfo/Idh/MocA family oxidoreductase [Balneolaceae bacterium]
MQKARELGIEAIDSSAQDPVDHLRECTGGAGADAVLLTASSSSDAVIKQAAQMSRKRGRIVLVGVVGLDLDRSDFYEKELSFQVSCSYGPGRYDEDYEQKGRDYPLPYVRWTEKRNFQAVLLALKSGQLRVDSLVTERLPLEDYLQIYGDMENSDSIASVLDYPEAPAPRGADEAERLRRSIAIPDSAYTGGEGPVAVVGAGNFTRSTVLPALKKAGLPVKYLVSSGGLSSTDLGKKYDVGRSTTDLEEVLEDPEVRGVLITTRHNLHAQMTVRALQAGKEVFVEKPLALSEEELDDVAEAAAASSRTVMVGFNRRFSPHTLKMKDLVGPRPGPMNVVATMNAGHVPPEAWLHDPEVGGGRIVGEACHLVDLITALTGSLVTRVSMQAMGERPDRNTDNATLQLKYANGSLGVVNYFANGNKSYSKERVELYYQGKNLVLDNFRKLYGYGFGSTFNFSNTLLSTRQDKGHERQFARLASAWREGGAPLIPFDELLNSSRATLAALRSLQEGGWVEVPGAGS